MKSDRKVQSIYVRKNITLFATTYQLVTVQEEDNTPDILEKLGVTGVLAVVDISEEQAKRLVNEAHLELKISDGFSKAISQAIRKAEKVASNPDIFLAKMAKCEPAMRVAKVIGCTSNSEIKFDKETDAKLFINYLEWIKTQKGECPLTENMIKQIYPPTKNPQKSFGCHYDICDEFIPGDKENSKTCEYDCWVSPVAMDVAVEAEEEQAAIVEDEKREYRVEYLVWFRKEQKAKIVIEENPEFIANDEVSAFPRKYNLHNDDVNYKGFILTDKQTDEIIRYYMAHRLKSFFDWLPEDGKTDTNCHATAKIVDNRENAPSVEDTAISELVTVIADAGYNVPESIINGTDKQATLEHLTIVAETAGLIEPIELYK